MSCAMEENQSPEKRELQEAGEGAGAPEVLVPVLHLLLHAWTQVWGCYTWFSPHAMANHGESSSGLVFWGRCFPQTRLEKKKGGGGEEGAENFFLSALERVNVGLERSKITNALTVSVSVSQLTFLSDPACQGLLQMNTNDLGLHYPIITQILLLIYV